MKIETVQKVLYALFSVQGIFSIVQFLLLPNIYSFGSSIVGWLVGYAVTYFKVAIFLFLHPIGVILLTYILIPAATEQNVQPDFRNIKVGWLLGFYALSLVVNISVLCFTINLGLLSAKERRQFLAANSQKIRAL